MGGRGGGHAYVCVCACMRVCTAILENSICMYCFACVLLPWSSILSFTAPTQNPPQTKHHLSTRQALSFNNMVGGPIPASMSKLTELQDLDLEGTKHQPTGNNFR